jgi:flagellar hook protein FlgE
MSLNTSVSALNAFSDRLGVQANNIANVNTNEFKKGRTLMQETEPSGVRNTYDRVDTPGPLVSQSTGTGQDIVELSNVELAEEMPQMNVSLRGLQSNTAAVRTEDEMLGTILDMKA